MIKSVTFQIVTKVNIGNKTFKSREGTDVSIWGKISSWVYYTLTEKKQARDVIQMDDAHIKTVDNSTEFTEATNAKHWWHE